ncbi:UNKNOWN [Stylonychia lemnae]|uniref:Zinc-finger domain-containing protein n=1 Tax=Stylonychia lemnae TaxID=5949 RepID=A0A078A651_STYLE|nr:UNKNOWN [Stylonychia lemnae]|eukprot:CDW77674.1 UNKNOWN [Stylonychia lemnae]
MDQEQLSPEIVKRVKKAANMYTPISQTTRKKTIDFSKVGQKITLSDSSCHRCKTMIPVNEENICKGPLIDINMKKPGSLKKKIEPCSKRFCNECLQKYNKDSWTSMIKNIEIWVCPYCLEICTCAQCNRKRTKEGQIKNQFLAQFDQPDKNQNKRQEKVQQKQLKHMKSMPEIKRGKKAMQNLTPQQVEGVKETITDEEWQAYNKSRENFLSEGISQQDVMNIRQVFENLRDENDRPNEVKLSKLQKFPFFNKTDLSRFPKDSERIANQMRDSDYKQDYNEGVFSGRNIQNYQQQQAEDANEQNQQNKHHNNQQYHQQQKEESNVSCFLWPLFGQQQS